MRSLASGAARTVWVILLLAAFSILWLKLGWVGYIGSDDWVYILNARARLEDPFLIGVNHWQVRMTLTLPMAASFAVFGESELAAALPTLIYSLATTGLVFLYLKRTIGLQAAALAAVLLLSNPLLVVNATSLRIDTVENFLVLASVLCLLISASSARGSQWMTMSGVLAGLAFVTRPTAVALLAFHAVMLLSGWLQLPKRRYLFAAIGFGLVWVSESIYYWSSTGTWFYRLGIDFNHDQVVRSGSLLDAVFLGPLRMLLSSHSFGLVFWLFLPLAWVGLRSTAVAEKGLLDSSTHVRILSTFVVVWIVVFSVFASKLVLDPRYLAPALSMALVVIAIGISHLFRSGSAVVATISLGALLFVQGLGLAVENKDFLYAERWLVKEASQRNEVIYTDPQTRERALFLLQLAGVEDRTRIGPVPKGALFLYVPRNVSRGMYNKLRWMPEDYTPGPWPIVDTVDPGPSFLGQLLAPLSVQGILPAAVWQKLVYPNPPVDLLRRPT